MTRTRELGFADDIKGVRTIFQRLDYYIVPIRNSDNFHNYYDREVDKLFEIKKKTRPL